MVFKNFLLLLLFALIFSTGSQAQQESINFTAITTREGLASNTVNAILKDRYGFLWFGTEDGLDRFDGTGFTVYRNKPNDTTSLQANEILALHEDAAGNLWIGTSGGSLSLYNRKKDAFINFPANGGRRGLSNNVIRDICHDENGNIWIVHYTGVNILDPKTGKVSSLPLTNGQKGQAAEITGTAIFRDSRNNIWVGTTQGLWQYHPGTRQTRHFTHDPANPLSLAGRQVNAIAEDKDGTLWIGTNNGLSRLNSGTLSFVNYRESGGGVRTMKSEDFINDIKVEGNQLWIGTGTGLKVFNKHTGEQTEYNQDPRNHFSLSGQSVQCVYIDQQGIYWLGTFRGGVNKYDKNLNLFSHIRSNVFDSRGLNVSTVTSFAEAGQGKLFVGTDGGLSVFDRQTNYFEQVPLSSSRSGAPSHPAILAMKMTRSHQLAIGTFADGLFLMDPVSRRYRQLMHGETKDDLNANDIFCITEDRNGNLWLGTNGEGINVLTPSGKVLKRYTPVPKASNDIRLPINGYIRDIVEDREGLIWIATHGGGLASLSQATGAFTTYNTTNSRLPNDKVQTLIEDRDGNIWAGTLGGGLAIFNRATKQFTVVSEEDGLQNNAIYKILEDEKGMMWVSSNTGISRIEGAAMKVSNFNYYNGVPRNNFIRGAGIRLSDGELFFGGLEGISHFRPAFLKKNTSVPAVRLTELLVANQSVSPSEKGPIATHISVANEINLDYKQNFALRYVGLSYTAPEQNQYAYKLEGFDKDWNYVGNVTTASYTNLDPGEYLFHVKASNNDGVWNEEGTVIRIRVHPPFWRTTYAYFGYAFLLIGGLLFIRHKGIQKIKRKFALEQEKMKADQERREAERVHELDMQKIKFLTNLSHEFRTPISLILGPVDTLLQQQKSTTAAEHLGLIKRNAKRLLNLVNQLLDFRKMEEQELQLNATEGELVQFVEEVSDAFRDLSERKKITFQMESRLAHFYTRFDHDKLERILFNLLSNAFKFTLPGGSIGLLIDEKASLPDSTKKEIVIKISDSGIGIPADKIEKIFETFYQASTPASILNQGTGIGLSITKEFVKMHGGTISADSVPDKGTTFTIVLPLVPLPAPATDTFPVAETSDETEADDAAFATGDTMNTSEQPVVLIVEDNDDFRFYLKDNLQLHYKVLEASNGKEGWQKALAHHPQLIVSDVNMPVMDGIRFCNKIKADKRTSHIPVILLTALTAEEDQVKGLQTGANDYVTKPFNFDVLNMKIRNLLQLNNQLKNTYSKQIKVVAPEVAYESAEEKLLQTIAVYLEENLTNSQLSVEELSRHVGMSRSTLYSKLLELTGQTPVEYIRSVKLEKAAVMLEKSDMNVAQVAYSAGFSTPNYFAKSFKAKYGLLPSEYMSKMRKDEVTKNDSN